MLERRDTDIVDKYRLESGPLVPVDDSTLGSLPEVIAFAGHMTTIFGHSPASLRACHRPTLPQRLHYAFKDAIEMRTR